MRRGRPAVRIFAVTDASLAWTRALRRMAAQRKLRLKTGRLDVSWPMFFVRERLAWFDRLVARP